jgi:hypothetical protein
VTDLYRQAGRQQQHEHSTVPGLLIERAESSIKRAEKGLETGILYSQSQWCASVGKGKIADEPTGASGDNNTRF